MGAIPWAPQFGNGDTAVKALMIDFDGLGHYLQPSAAISLRALAREFESVFGVPFTISEAFRDIPTQNYFWNLYQSGRGNPAAFPGTSSHGQGLAVDINSWVYGNRAGTDRHNWLVNNAGRFGWSWYLVGKPSGEPWHFNYVGGWTDWASDNSNYTPIKKEWYEDMNAEDKKDLQDAVAAALASKFPQNLYVVYAAFKSGDGPIAQYGQGDNNYYLVNLEAGTYRWLVTPGQINYCQNKYGVAERQDAAFFVGLENDFRK